MPAVEAVAGAPGLSRGFDGVQPASKVIRTEPELVVRADYAARP